MSDRKRQIRATSKGSVPHLIDLITLKSLLRESVDGFSQY